MEGGEREEKRVGGRRGNGPNSHPPWERGPHLKSFISSATTAVGKQKAWDGGSKSREEIHSTRRAEDLFLSLSFSLFLSPFSFRLSFWQRCVHLSRLSVASSSLSLAKILLQHCSSFGISLNCFRLSMFFVKISLLKGKRKKRRKRGVRKN